MDKLSTIVVGIDFTRCCVAALREAMRISKWNQATLRPIHVIDSVVAIELEEALAPSMGPVRDQLIADAKAYWPKFASQVPGAAELPLEVRIDARVRGLLGYLQEFKTDLLVLGARSDDEPDVGVGTVATACVRHATSPVLLVRERQDKPFATVVACVDFSQTALLALDQAARVAEQDGASLHVLHAFEPPWRRLHYRAPTPQTAPHFQQQYRDGLERRLRAFADLLGRDLAKVNAKFTVYEYTGYRSAIVEYAREAQADLIVLGTRGRTNLRDVLLGSTAEKVLRESPCSVLAVRPDATASPLTAGHDKA
jgi:nucleotide-binding universal stress UspA family protein